MEWRFTGERPVYQQIVDLIEGAVLSGEYPVGSRVPSVRELAAEARVNPNTMQRALGELERQGLLIGSGTAGRHVTDDVRVLKELREKRMWELARECARQFAAYGLSPHEAAAMLDKLEEE